MEGRNGEAQAAMYSVLDSLQGVSSQLRSGSYPLGVRDERIDAVGHPTNIAHQHRALGVPSQAYVSG